MDVHKIQNEAKGYEITPENIEEFKIENNLETEFQYESKIIDIEAALNLIF